MHGLKTVALLETQLQCHKWNIFHRKSVVRKRACQRRVATGWSEQKGLIYYCRLPGGITIGLVKKASYAH